MRSEYTIYLDDQVEPPLLVCQVGGTRLRVPWRGRSMTYRACCPRTATESRWARPATERRSAGHRRGVGAPRPATPSAAGTPRRRISRSLRHVRAAPSRGARPVELEHNARNNRVRALSVFGVHSVSPSIRAPVNSRRGCTVVSCPATATLTHTAALARLGHALSDPTRAASCSRCGIAGLSVGPGRRPRRLPPGHVEPACLPARLRARRVDSGRPAHLVSPRRCPPAAGARRAAARRLSSIPTVATAKGAPADDDLHAAPTTAAGSPSPDPLIVAATIGYNLIEAVIAIAAGTVASSTP